jgi:hypothetical protein
LTTYKTPKEAWRDVARVMLRYIKLLVYNALYEGLKVVDVFEVLSITIPVLISIALLAYWLGAKFVSIGERFSVIDKRFKELREDVADLRDAFAQYNEVLLSVLETKGMLSRSEILALKGVLSSLKPSPTSKYYTEEVAKRLDELLAKDPEELTSSDLSELERIADRIWREGYESNRGELREYGKKLKLYTTMVKVVFIYPKLRKLREVL